MSDGVHTKIWGNCFELTLCYYIKLHFLPSISQKNFSGTRFSERIYFYINESIGQLGAGEGLEARGSL